MIEHDGRDLAMRFYALMVHELCEGSALRRIKSQLGLHAVSPVLVERKRTAKRALSTRRGPIFRGYVFVGLPVIREAGRDIPVGWRDVERVRGADRFVRFGNDSYPLPLPVGFVEEIEGVMDEDGVVGEGASQWRGRVTIDPLRARIAAKLKTDVIIRDVDSAFCGLPGEIDFSNVVRALLNLDAHGRVRILMRIMNATFPVEVDRDQVEIVTAFDRGVRARGSSQAPIRTTVRRTA